MADGEEEKVFTFAAKLSATLRSQEKIAENGDGEEGKAKEGDKTTGLEHEITISFPDEDEETIALKSLLNKEATEITPWSKTYERQGGEDLIVKLASSPVMKVVIKYPKSSEGENDMETKCVLNINMSSFIFNRMEIEGKTMGDIELCGKLAEISVSLTVDRSVLSPELAETLLPLELTIKDVADIPSSVDVLQCRYSFFGLGDVKSSLKSRKQKHKMLDGGEGDVDESNNGSLIAFSPVTELGIRKVFLLKKLGVNISEFLSRIEWKHAHLYLKNDLQTQRVARVSLCTFGFAFRSISLRTVVYSQWELTPASPRFISQEHPLLIEVHPDPDPDTMEEKKAEEDITAEENKDKGKEEEKKDDDGDQEEIQPEVKLETLDWDGPLLTKSKKIFGFAKISLHDIIKGCDIMELSAELLPEYPAVFEKERDLRAPGTLLEGGSRKQGGSKTLINPFHIVDDTGMILQSELSLSVRIAHPLPKSLLTHRHPFSRAVFVLRYDDIETLRSLMEVIKVAAQKNLNLPDSQKSTIQAYRLSQEEATSPSIDVITGFQLVDDNFRYIILEGASQIIAKAKRSTEAAEQDKKEEGEEAKKEEEEQKNEGEEVKTADAVNSVAQDGEIEKFTTIEKLVKTAPLARRVSGSILEEATLSLNSNGPIALLHNPEVTFEHRLYADFHLELKSIKLTHTLDALEKQVSTFMMQNSREKYLRCISRLISLKNATKHGLKSAKIERVFPRIEELRALEKKFGKEVLDEDIGLPPRELPTFVTARNDSREGRKPSASTKSKSRRKLQFKINDETVLAMFLSSATRRSQTLIDAASSTFSSRSIGNDSGDRSTGGLELRRTMRQTRTKPWEEEVVGDEIVFEDGDLDENHKDVTVSQAASRAAPLLDVSSLEDETLNLFVKLYGPILKQSSEALSAFREFGNGGLVNKYEFVQSLDILDGVSLSAKELESVFGACCKQQTTLDIYAFRRTVHAAKVEYDNRKIAAAKHTERGIDEAHFADTYDRLEMSSGKKIEYAGHPVYMYSGQRQTRNKNLHQTHNLNFLSQSVDFTNAHDDLTATNKSEAKKRTRGSKRPEFRYYVPTDPHEYTIPPKTLHPSKREEIGETIYSEMREAAETIKVRYRTCPRCGAKTLIEREKCRRCRLGFNRYGKISQDGVFGYKLEEAEESRSKLKGDPAFMTYLQGNSKKRPSQIDRNETILKTKPKKISLKKTHAPHLPHNMFLVEPKFKEQKKRGFAKVRTENGHDKRDKFDRGLRRSQANFHPLHKRTAKPMKPAEKRGPRWGGK
eukprot:jgi/Bigna1/69197/fgenesh1_pg.8_\